MMARELATKLASVPERALSALPDLPANPWRRQRSALPAGLAVFGLGLVLGIGIGLLLFAESVAEGEDVPAGAHAEPQGSPIQ